MMLTTPAVDAVAILSRLGMRGTYDRWRSRARQLPEFGGDLPVATLADEIETGRTGTRARARHRRREPGALGAQRAASRSRSRHARARRLDRWISQRDDAPRARAAPARAAALACALRSRAVRLLGAQRGEVFGAGHPATRRRSGSIGRSWPSSPVGSSSRVRFAGSPLVAARRLRPERIVDALLRIGPHRLTLAKLRRSPHGVDLGPLEPGRFRARIATPDRMADVAPGRFPPRGARSNSSPEADRETAGELVLIGRRQLRRQQFLDAQFPASGERPAALYRCLSIPTDAASRHLANGDLARLGSDAGAVVVPVEVTEAMRPEWSACRTAGVTIATVPALASRANTRA